MPTTLVYLVYLSVPFTEVNPDKGTEIIIKHLYLINYPFTEVNPDKGTEIRVRGDIKV